jgi:hypothetical protein
MMEMHVLPGDSLVEIFQATKIEGEIVVCRECLVDGDVSGETLDEFWEVRAKFLSGSDTDSEKSYKFYAKPEFEKILNVPDLATVNLWFEYELFCQVNMWFCLYLLRDSKAHLFRVEPIVRSTEDLWFGFGGLDEGDLKKCFAPRKRFSREDIALGADLWLAFQNHDFARLDELSKTQSVCFPHLKEVCEAACEQQTRPKNVMQKIVSDGETDFGKAFRKFNETEGVYGFGDLQVKRIFDQCQDRLR